MHKLSFDLPEGTIVVEAILVANVMDEEGIERFKMVRYGNPRATSQIGMLEAGLRRTNRCFDRAWEEG